MNSIFKHNSFQNIQFQKQQSKNHKMDKRLLEASQTGNTQELHQLLSEDPMTLHRVVLSSSENPLHVASMAGQVSFAREILRLKPDFAAQINEDGFSPMHLASANGYLEIVRELVRVDRRLCLVKGRNMWTPLHLAAGRGRSDVIREILSACPNSIEDVTAQRESALHVAVKNGQSEAVGVMLRWVRDMKKDEMVLNLRDELGNSILHVATWKKNRQVLEWLLENNKATLQLINSVNNRGLTPLDTLLIFPSEAGDREIEKLLHAAGAAQATKDILIISSDDDKPPNQATTPEKNNIEPDTAEELIEYFKFKKERDTPSDARTALLVMAVLVATATFQVGINPPSGVWQDSNQNGNKTTPSHYAGTSIMGSYSSTTHLVFVIFNSIGLSVSLYMLTILTSDFPMRLEFEICVLALYVTYFTGLGFMAPQSSKIFMAVFSAVVPMSIFYLVKLLRLILKRLKCVVSLLRRCALFSALSRLESAL